MSEHLRCRRFKRCTEQFIRLWVNSCVQPILFAVESDHGFVDNDVIRIPTRFGLYLCLVNPIVNGRAIPFDTEYIMNRNSIRKRKTSELQLNTELHQKHRCHFSFHKL